MQMQALCCRWRDDGGLPGEDGQLWLDDLHPDDDEQQGADDQDDELQQSLQDSIREAAFPLQEAPQRVQQHGQGELREQQQGKKHTGREGSTPHVAYGVHTSFRVKFHFKMPLRWFFLLLIIFKFMSWWMSYLTHCSTFSPE